MKQPLDLYDYKPEAQKAYLRNYGWHFNKKACEYAVSLMKTNDGNGNTTSITPWTREQVDEMLSKFNINLKNKTCYDYVYVANKCKADNFRKSVIDEQHAMMYVRETIDDIDGNDGDIMRSWYAKMVGGGMPVEWEDMI